VASSRRLPNTSQAVKFGSGSGSLGGLRRDGHERYHTTEDNASSTIVCTFDSRLTHPTRYNASFSSLHVFFFEDLVCILVGDLVHSCTT
jgi:hypothetical protein